MADCILYCKHKIRHLYQSRNKKNNYTIKKNYSFTLPAVKPLTKYFSKYMKTKSTGKVTITEPAIKYCRGVSASPLKY